MALTLSRGRCMARDINRSSTSRHHAPSLARSMQGGPRQARTLIVAKGNSNNGNGSASGFLGSLTETVVGGGMNTVLPGTGGIVGSVAKKVVEKSVDAVVDAVSDPASDTTTKTGGSADSVSPAVDDVERMLRDSTSNLITTEALVNDGGDLVRNVLGPRSRQAQKDLAALAQDLRNLPDLSSSKRLADVVADCRKQLGL